MKVSDWKKGIEMSKYYLPIITPNFFNDPIAIEQAIYAKQLKKPTILFIVKNTEFAINDLFDNVVMKIEIEDIEDFKKREKEISKKILKLTR